MAADVESPFQLYGGPKYAAAGDFITVKSSAAAIPTDAMTMTAVRIGDRLGNLQAIIASPEIKPSSKRELGTTSNGLI
jgi:hypothetical protein